MNTDKTEPKPRRLTLEERYTQAATVRGAVLNGVTGRGKIYCDPKLLLDR